MWGGGEGYRGSRPPSGKSKLALGILRNIGTDPTGALLLEGGSYFPLWNTLIKNVARTPGGIFWICPCFNMAIYRLKPQWRIQRGFGGLLNPLPNSCFKILYENDIIWSH